MSLGRELARLIPVAKSEWCYPKYLGCFFDGEVDFSHTNNLSRFSKVGKSVFFVACFLVSWNFPWCYNRIMEEMSRKKKIIYVLVFAFAIALVLRVFVVEGFIVRGDSMHPAIESGDYVFVNKLAYIWSEPKRGDVVVAVSRVLPTKLLKRIVGLPGERFEIKDGQIILRDNRTDPGKVLRESYLDNPELLTEGNTLIVLDAEEYFALGDNREVSIDSRELGLIDKWDIKGKIIGAFSFKKFFYKGF